jgi:hypothetical protein
MDIQVNKHQLERVIIKWLNKYYGNLIQKKHKYYPNSVFYVNSDNEVLMEYSPINKYIHIHHEYIYLKIQSLFHLNYLQVQSIIKVWLKEKPYELGEVTPSAFVVSPLTSWKRHTNWND